MKPLVMRKPGDVRLSVPQLARETGMTERMVRKHIKIAERHGWLIVDRAEKGEPQGFTLTIPEGFDRA
jgi:biotin operon repressor